MIDLIRFGAVLGCACLLTATAATGAENGAESRAEQPGTRFELRVQDLPPPYASPSVSNAPQRIARPDRASLRVPDGFVVTLFADQLEHPRNLIAAPNGDIFVARQSPGVISLLRDTNHDGVADQVETFADGFDEPFGLAVRDDALYVADTVAVWRLPYQLETRPDSNGGRRARVAVTPRGALGSGTGHSTRTLAFAPDGQRFYVAIGSASNIAEEAEPRATVQEFSADGRPLGTFASGLRNPVGLAFRPGTEELYTVVNERDGLGDGLVPDYLVRLQRGGFYGWPYSYLGAHPQPRLGGRRPDLVSRAIVPDVLFQAHSAPLGLVFYHGTQFPPDYRGDALVALHGSWNAGQPTGYKVVRVPFRDGKLQGYYENFAVGFRLAAPTVRAQVWGRPVGLAVTPDGCLLIADDAGNAIWQISYRGG